MLPLGCEAHGSFLITFDATRTTRGHRMQLNAVFLVQDLAGFDLAVIVSEWIAPSTRLWN
jgi:hypothetical protein